MDLRLAVPRCDRASPCTRCYHAEPVLGCTAPVPAHKSYPYLNILSAYVERIGNDCIIEIRAVELHGKHEGIAIVRGVVDSDHAEQASTWAEQLLNKAYGASSCPAQRD